MSRPITGYITGREGPSIEGLNPLYALLDNGRRVIGRAWSPVPGVEPQQSLHRGDRVLATEIQHDVWEFRRVQ